jgi:16S rRNA (cytosine1402-N4)-methyltransferase
MSAYHKPVMLDEVLEFLRPENGKIIIDCTLGGGGHSLEIVKRIVPDGMLVGIDRDSEALAAAAERLASYSENVTLKKGAFGDLSDIAKELGLKTVDGALFDLGVSSHQLDAAERGFSFRQDAPLDMRMDTSEDVTAEDLVNTLSESELADIIWRYGEERWAKRIAQFIVKSRKIKPVKSTGDLVDVIMAAIPQGARKGAIHPATRTFQALRIAVNRELEMLKEGLDAAIGLLKVGGRICVLSYHSLEDRIVKETFLSYSGRCTCPPPLPVCVCGAKKSLEILTRRPALPTDAEIIENARARSAKLRVAEKV